MNYSDAAAGCPLFDGIEPGELGNVLECLGARKKRYKKGEIILSEGDPAEYLGIVLDGSVQIVRDDYFGNRSVIAGVQPPQIFGESFACARADALPVSVIAASECAVMLISARRIMQPCSKGCGYHSTLIYNLLKIMAGKNLIFHQRIEVTSKRTTCEKLMTYLLIKAKECGSDSFTIPFDRQALADYLDVDRSGLSAEIGKLTREGVISCKRSRFTINKH